MKNASILLGTLVVAGFGFLLFAGVTNAPSTNEEPALEANAIKKDMLHLSSSAFENNEPIPSKYTCDEERTMNPPLSLSGVPAGTHSLVLIMDDPDIPQVFKDERGIDSFDHWVMYGIDPKTSGIGEGEVPGKLGLNGRGEEGYTGPCPPPEYEPTKHRYIFKLYALKGSLQFQESPTKAEVLAAMSGMILDEATLIGTYDRKK